MKLPFIVHPEQNFDLLKNKGVSLAAFLDTIRSRKDETCSVRLRIIFKRTPKYYTTKINLTESEFLKLLEPKPRGDLKDKKQVIFQLLKKANDIIIGMPEFSFDKFKILFQDKHGTHENIFSAFEREIKQLNTNDRIGTASSYQCSLNSLKEFKKVQKLTFDQINIRFLNEYEAWMLKQGNSQTTVGIYLRNLRKLFNDAINAGVIKQDSYPFGKGKYKIPASRNIKKALRIADIGKLYKYQIIEDSPEHYYRDLWFFSYFCNGINIKDICLLKYKNIHGESIQFARAKTAITNRNPIPISIYITPEIQSIITRWGNKKKEPDNFIFPILKKRMTPEIQQKRIRQTVKQVNKYINRIAESVGIEQKVTTYTARHSFATVLKRSGVNTEFISESLGHADLKTTQNYLDSFEPEMKKEIAGKLLDFGE